MRNKGKTKTSFPQPHCFFPDSTSLPNLLPPPPSITRNGEQGLWLVPSDVSTASSSSLFCSSMGSHTRDTILHKPLQCRLSPRAEVLQEWSALVWVLQEILLLKAPTSFRAPVGCSKGCRVDIYSTMVLHGLQGENLLHKNPLPRLQALLCTWSTALLPSLWPRYLQSCLSLLSLTPFSKHIQRCPQYEWVTQLGLCSVSPGAAWNGLCPMSGSSQCFLPEAIPAAPCSKTLPHKLNTNMHSAEYHSTLWPGLQFRFSLG